MSNFGEALGNTVRGGLCQVLSVPEYVNDTMDRVGFFPFTEARRAIPDFWRNLLCDTPAPNPNPSPFQGGQCSARYRLTGSVFAYPNQQCIGNEQPFDFGSWWGPITNVSLVIEGTFPNGRNYALRFTSFGNLSFPKSIPETTELFVGSSFNGCPAVSLTQFTPTRTDGLPDNCGNPDPEYRDVTPSDTTINTTINYVNALGVAIVAPVTIVYGFAFVNAQAQILIPFTLNLSPTVAFQGTVSIDGQVNVNLIPSGGGGLPKDPRKSPCDDIALTDEEPDEDPTDSDQPNQPDRDAEKVIKGVLVTVTSLSSPRASTIFQDENPDIYAPNLGFVNFLCRVGTTSGGWTTDIPVKNRRHLIQCPWDLGAVAVRGTPQPGVTWVLTPVYGFAGVPVQYPQPVVNGA